MKKAAPKESGSKAPTKVTLRTYNVGFGDCFLLTFHYADRDRHILIDFGSTRAPTAFAKKKDFMTGIANDIRTQCGGKLDAVVATHRHKDHISGFTTGKNKSGDVIRGLKPDLVIQPWTEDPKTAKNAREPVQDPGNAMSNFMGGLRKLHQVAGAIEAVSQRSWFGRDLKAQLQFLGDDNLANRSAIDNLQTMGAKNSFVYFGSKTGLERILPGVKVRVLGPPTLKQSDRIRKQRGNDQDAFWMFASFWALQAQAAGRLENKSRLFPHARVNSVVDAPIETRWTIKRLRALHGEQLLSIVRALDQAMNNTSVILLFETGGKRLLFPGDAQIENWSYALETLKEAKELSILEEVDLYKVGHHGSRNATPKSLWNAFKKRSKTKKSGRLRTVMSTKAHVHGKTEATAVPRQTLVDQLATLSELHDTEKMKASQGWFDKLEIDL